MKEDSGLPYSGKTEAGRDAGHMALVVWWTHLDGVVKETWCCWEESLGKGGRETGQ